MKIHECQAKNLFSSFGIPVPQGEVATSAEQAREDDNGLFHHLEIAGFPFVEFIAGTFVNEEKPDYLEIYDRFVSEHLGG